MLIRIFPENCFRLLGFASEIFEILQLPRSVCWLQQLNLKSCDWVLDQIHSITPLKFNSKFTPETLQRDPIGKQSSIPSIFQGRFVKLQGCNVGLTSMILLRYNFH